MEPTYDEAHVQDEADRLRDRERISTPPAEGDDPLVKATAVWDGWKGMEDRRVAP